VWQCRIRQHFVAITEGHLGRKERAMLKTAAKPKYPRHRRHRHYQQHQHWRFLGPSMLLMGKGRQLMV